MTNKEAIFKLIEYRRMLERNYEIDVEPFDMATEALERKRGEWTREYTLYGTLKDTFWHCSVCGYKNSDSFANFDHKFCPNCGADMRGGAE